VAVITIGAPAIGRTDSANLVSTYIGKDGPADGTGEITSVEIWLFLSCDVSVATFIDEGSNVFSTRDSEDLGTIADGSKQTASGLHMDVVENDYLGIARTGGYGYIERDEAGYAGIWWEEGEHIPCSSLEFGFVTTDAISLYGTGATGVDHEKALSDTVAIADTFSRQVDFERTPSDSVAIADSLARTVEFYRTFSDTVTIADAISKAVSIPLADSVAIAEALVKGIGLVKADNVAIADSFSRVVEFYRSLTDTVNIADVISKAVEMPLADSVAIVDSLVKAIGVNLTETIAIVDAITRKDIGLSLSDTVTITDTLIKMRVLVALYTLTALRVLDAIRAEQKERQL